jgi:hypothetical protein
MGETAKFCRARQPFCHKAEQVPQVVILYSTDSAYRQSNNVFCPAWDIGVNNLKGALHALLENQYSVEIKSECHLKDNLKDYPLVVVPEWKLLSTEFIRQLADYVFDGGNILVIGTESMSGIPDELKKETKFSFGKGKIVALPENLATEYATKRDPAVRAKIIEKVRTLCPNPMVEVKGSEFVDVVVNRKDGKLGIHLVNVSGPHADSSQPIIDSIDPIPTLDIAIRLDKKPGIITRQPAGTACNFIYENGIARLTLNNLEIYDILVIE